MEVQTGGLREVRLLLQGRVFWFRAVGVTSNLRARFILQGKV